jgi:ribonuclease J
MIKIYTIGGFSEVGKNMTAVDLGEDVIIFDCGLFLPPIVEMETQEKVWNERKLRDIDAVPNDLILDKLGLRNKVRAILVSHAHLDHVGAIPYLAHRYNAPVVATPFTIEVLKSLVKDTGKKLKNNLKSIPPNGTYTIHGKKKDYKVEFLNITHSTIQAALIALHTDHGVILYANDFKFDNYPVLGKKPNYKRLRELANSEKGILCLIVDSLYSGSERKTPSEKIARGLLEDVLLTTSNQGSAIIITTFSSHLARLKSIVNCARQLGRKVVFVGRSLRRYVGAADRLKLVPFMKNVDNLISYRNEIEKVLKKVMKNRSEWMIVCTGHQGEPGSVLERMSRDTMPFKILANDHIIFSSSIIPSPINVANRKKLEKRLKAKGARIFTDVHVSGHCGREDLRDLIEMTRPQNIIPAHGDLSKLSPMVELAREMGYKMGKTVHLMQDGQKLVL